jgi:hypothetical protein
VDDPLQVLLDLSFGRFVRESGRGEAATCHGLVFSLGDEGRNVRKEPFFLAIIK